MKEMRVKVKDIVLQIRVYEGEGDTIIFLHFSGANLMMWQRVVPYFQDHYRIILVDLRGHGKSDKPETGYYMDEMAADIFEIMKHLNIEQAHIVGSSLGAEVGLSLAANYPDKVISLVCDGALSSEYGPYGTWEGSRTDFEEHVESQLENMRNTPETIYPSVEALVEKNREVLEKYGWWNEYVDALVRYDAYELDEGKYMKSFSRRSMAEYMKNYFQYRFEDYYKTIKCPILMLPGEDVFENEREKAAMEGLRDLAEKGEIVKVDGWMHPYGWLLDPEGVSKVILKFLDDATEVERNRSARLSS